MAHQNISTAVMNRRHESRNSLDDFPTPPWAARALCKYVLHRFIPDGALKNMTVWEPACNRGFLIKGLQDYFSSIHATDIIDYGWKGQSAVQDFLFIDREYMKEVDWIITNPPFRLAEQFIKQSFMFSNFGCAMFVRTSFLEGVKRFHDLFSQFPPDVIAQFSERVPLIKGRYDPKASTATSYCWLVWSSRISNNKQQFIWIPPCRKELERDGDYPGNPKALMNCSETLFEGGDG